MGGKRSNPSSSDDSTGERSVGEWLPSELAFVSLVLGFPTRALRYNPGGRTIDRRVGLCSIVLRLSTDLRLK